VLSARAKTELSADEIGTFWHAPETQWYREQGDSIAELISKGPMIEVIFTGEQETLNTC